MLIIDSNNLETLEYLNYINAPNLSKLLLCIIYNNTLFLVNNKIVSLRSLRRFLNLSCLTEISLSNYICKRLGMNPLK